MLKVVIPRVEVAVKIFIGSSGRGPNSDVQNLYRRYFLWNAGNNPLMSTYSRFHLNTDQDRNDENRNEENIEEGDFPASGPIFYRRAPAHHKHGSSQNKNQKKQTVKNLNPINSCRNPAFIFSVFARY